MIVGYTNIISKDRVNAKKTAAKGALSSMPVVVVVVVASQRACVRSWYCELVTTW